MKKEVSKRTRKRYGSRRTHRISITKNKRRNKGGYRRRVMEGGMEGEADKSPDGGGGGGGGGGSAEPPVIMAERNVDLERLNYKIDLLARIILSDINPSTHQIRRNRIHWGPRLVHEIQQKSPEWIPFLLEYSMKINSSHFGGMAEWARGQGGYSLDYKRLFERYHSGEFEKNPAHFLQHLYVLDDISQSDPWKPDF